VGCTRFGRSQESHRSFAFAAIGEHLRREHRPARLGLIFW
jgi:hypothetical protein